MGQNMKSVQENWEATIIWILSDFSQGNPHVVMIGQRSTAKQLNTWATRLHQSVLDLVEHMDHMPWKNVESLDMFFNCVPCFLRIWDLGNKIACFFYGATMFDDFRRPKSGSSEDSLGPAIMLPSVVFQVSIPLVTQQ